MNSPHPFFIALQFLTRWPVRLPGPASETQQGRSLLYYPVVGLLIGLLLALCNIALGDASSFVSAALLLVVWVLITGGLHLDGLADSADAWVGGHGDRERTLAIMKDTHCGAMGVIALVLVLLAKFAALTALGPADWLELLLIPMLARATIPMLFMTTPYARNGGLGAALAAQVPKRAVTLLLIVMTLTLLAFLRWGGALLIAAALLVFAAGRWMMMRRIGGTTGDTAGALVEIAETVMLTLLALTTPAVG